MHLAPSCILSRGMTQSAIPSFNPRSMAALLAACLSGLRQPAIALNINATVMWCVAARDAREAPEEYGTASTLVTMAFDECQDDEFYAR